MPKGIRTCPRCRTANHTKAAECKKCGAPFGTGKTPRGKAPGSEDDTWPAHRDAALVDFVPGLTSDGRLVLTWPAQYDRVALTKQQTELVRALLNGRGTA